MCGWNRREIGSTELRHAMTSLSQNAPSEVRKLNPGLNMKPKCCKLDCDFFCLKIIQSSGGRCSLVGIATPYVLDCPGFEPRFSRNFLDSSKQLQPPVKWVPCLFIGGKAAGACR